jgi:hypothetical protein
MKYLEIYTDQELEEFRANPSYNPRTKRKIKKGGKVYQLLLKMLKEKDDNEAPVVIVKKLREKSFIPV